MTAIPLALVAGFLGSGKTTLLEQTARRYSGRKIVFLVNEFSTRDIDGARLRQVAPDVEVVAGGSIFCRCLVTEFIARLSELPSRFGGPGTRVEGVIVEASGMADPRAAGRCLSESRLDRVYELKEIVTVVDPGSLLKLVHTLPNIRAQVEAAGQVLINKSDLASRAEIEAAETAVRAMNPRAAIHRTSFCRVEIDLFSRPFGLSPRGELAPCVDPRYERFEAPADGEFDIARFENALGRVAADIYRVKGYVIVDGRTKSLDVSAAGLRLGDAPAGTSPGLVFIVSGPSTQEARRFIEDVTRGRFQRSPN